MDSYFSIETSSVGEYKEKGSKFLSYAFPMEKETELLQRLAEIKTEHPKARHYCFAYRLGIDGHAFRMNDDGEPSGTAGKPIYGQILSHELSDVLVVVVRYFGGTKLGASGLIQAYKAAASDALDKAGRLEKILKKTFRIYFPLSQTGHVYNVVKSLHLDTGLSSFGENPWLETAVRIDEVQTVSNELKALLLRIPFEQGISMKEDDWGDFNVEIL